MVFIETSRNNLILANPNYSLIQERAQNLNTKNKKKLISVTKNTTFTSNVPGQMFFSDIISLNQIVTGSFDFQRIGVRATFNRAKIVFSCQYKGFSYANQVAANATYQPLYSPYGDEVRVMVIWDSQPNGTTAKVNEILESLDNQGRRNYYLNQVNPLPLISCPMNIENNRRFTVLRDFYQVLGDPTPSLSNPAGNPTVTTGSGSSPNMYKKTYLIELQKELTQKRATETRTVYNMSIDDDERSIISGELIFFIYSLKGNLNYTIDSTCYYTD